MAGPMRKSDPSFPLNYLLFLLVFLLFFSLGIVLTFFLVSGLGLYCFMIEFELICYLTYLEAFEIRLTF